jgi:hypothetical protein
MGESYFFLHRHPPLLPSSILCYGYRLRLALGCCFPVLQSAFCAGPCWAMSTTLVRPD